MDVRFPQGNGPRTFDEPARGCNACFHFVRRSHRYLKWKWDLVSRFMMLIAMVMLWPRSILTNAPRPPKYNLRLSALESSRVWRPTEALCSRFCPYIDPPRMPMIIALNHDMAGIEASIIGFTV